MASAQMPPLRRVLYVDDEPDIREIADLALGVVGQLEVLICGSGEEALTKVKAFDPDLLLFDVMKNCR
jgi:two-component system OmpR family response regulator